MTAVREPIGPATLVGTPREVRSRLDHSTAEQVIVLPVKRTDARHAGLLAQTLAIIVPFIDAALREQNDQTLKALVNAVVPKAPPRRPCSRRQPCSRVRARPCSKARTG